MPFVPSTEPSPPLLQDPKFIQAADFAPGDRCKIVDCWAESELHRIQSVEDPFFEVAYSLLWKQFSPASEMEIRSVIERRLGRRKHPSKPGDTRTFYEMALVLSKGEPVAVRDHTVILPADSAHAATTIVHLSHNLVLPAWRRSGVAAWMRAFPAASARELCAQAGLAGRIILAAEMEPMNPDDEARCVRLAAYEKAGFRKVDPSAVTFWQPDFRDAETIASTGFQPIPLHLVLRFCDADEAREVSGWQLLEVIDALYAMYSRELGADNIAHARSKISLPALEEIISLVPPTQILPS
jgi:GNAT superfamily N-acetyltransferase